MVDERLERIDNLARVAQVVIEDERDQRHRGRAVAIEHALALVAEDVDATLDGILESGKQRVPPRVGEILRLIDDD